MSDLIKKTLANEELEEWELTPEEAKRYGISYREQYVAKFKIKSPNQLFSGSWDNYRTEEQIENMYKQCIEKGKTWQELTGWKKQDYDPKVQY